ncbi:merozoite surface protein 10, putative [Plasmodium knowlesi strain H]|uniref:Merozoite surface protein 10, putative n=4 Tax=Plasmodium knowlesi TaxID=5850 RepID=A0A5K1UX38_PLAKH|nr:merozoite surface protein 10, putative [Plasmodium knowlesi strain H]OTN64331.1 MSP8-like protein [Plasmodium knowlesi]CAA9989123.1 merozoite surface protein 10, putative [Plasmodium knowlesi strain H]SBO27340.1 merozoite surface protein 10, putative [Plasmodium knowlesi strain H]SBO28962.1 merozoite surface protein 10, putative [Plasmodium knowlesi strain H]VVS78597.1 merozoite surface protein 10, putative [Plasmodium knowlesi strain H]|eukprot:XP_002261470.1 MSP8-like protein [Plasmodium knowlesi strain H]
MKRTTWNKSFTFTIFLLLHLNTAVHANGNELKGTDGVDPPKHQDITNDYNTLEHISSEGQISRRNDDSTIPQSNTQQEEEGSDVKEGNTFLHGKNVEKEVETYLIQEEQNKVNHTDLGTGKQEKASHHVQKNANLRSTSKSSSEAAVNQAYNFVQRNSSPLGKNKANIEQVARAQDDIDTTENDNTHDTKEHNADADNLNGEGDNAEKGNTENADAKKDNAEDANAEKDIAKNVNAEKDIAKNANADTGKGGEEHEEPRISPPAEQPTRNAPPLDHAEKIKNRLLKEGRELKETTSMIDNTVYNVEQIILKTKFYTTAIRNFVLFKVNHICEYSKCGPNARCYIVEKDKEECRCIANYMPDNSVDYFKCIPKTVKDCSKENGNCDVNAECSIDKKENIKCQCNHGYIGDGIFCVLGSQGKQSLCLLLLLLICLLHKFLF